MVLTLPACPQTASSPPSVAELTARAQRYLRDHQPDRALPFLQQIGARDSDNLNALANLGVLLFFQGHYGEAIPHLSAALRLSSQWATHGRDSDRQERVGEGAADSRKGSLRAEIVWHQSLQSIDDRRQWIRCGCWRYDDSGTMTD